jgi:hypothetical protein
MTASTSPGLEYVLPPIAAYFTTRLQTYFINTTIAETKLAQCAWRWQIHCSAENGTQLKHTNVAGSTQRPDLRPRNQVPSSGAGLLGSGFWVRGRWVWGLVDARGKVSCIASDGGVNPKARPSTPKPGPQPWCWAPGFGVLGFEAVGFGGLQMPGVSRWIS